MRLLHLVLQLEVAYLLVALEDEGVNLHLLATIDVERNGQTTQAVGRRGGGHLHTGIAFVDIVTFDFVGRGAQQVLRHHIACRNVDLLTQLVGLAFLHTGKAELVQPRALLEDYLQKHDIALDTGDTYLHILEHALLPQVVDGSGDLVARKLHLVAHLQASHQLHHTGVKILGTLEGDTADFVCLGSEIVEIVSIATTHNHLGLSHKRHYQQEGCQQQFLYILHLQLFFSPLSDKRQPNNNSLVFVLLYY